MRFSATPIPDWLGGVNMVVSRSARARAARENPAATQTEHNEFMSQHRSLRAAAKLGGKRNVLKRFERVEILKKRGEWKPGDRITGLRKTKPE